MNSIWLLFSLSLSACVYLRSEEKQIFFLEFHEQRNGARQLYESYRSSAARADFPLAKNSIDFRMCSRRFSKKSFFCESNYFEIIQLGPCSYTHAARVDDHL